MEPHALFDDIHLTATGGLLDTMLLDGTEARLPALPVQFDRVAFGLRSNPPATGEHTKETLRGIGYSDAEIDDMLENEIIGVGAR